MEVGGVISPYAIIRNNRLVRNNLGLFWCWGVKFGLAEKNKIDANRSYGISIGHNDTDNVIRNNTITGSGKVGILFRDDSRGRDFWANRNRIENNRVENSGDKDGIAIDIQGRTKDITITGNQLLETRKPMNRVGIRISSNAKRIRLEKNAINGFAHALKDQRTTSS